jgi:hypothetical protein
MSNLICLSIIYKTLKSSKAAYMCFTLIELLSFTFFLKLLINYFSILSALKNWSLHYLLVVPHCSFVSLVFALQIFNYFACASKLQPTSGSNFSDEEQLSSFKSGQVNVRKDRRWVNAAQSSVQRGKFKSGRWENT